MLTIISFVLLLIREETVIHGKIDIDWDNQMQEIHKDYKCGIENKYEQSIKTRVINGRETNNIRYPWLVEIVHVYQLQPNVPDGKSKFKRCGGTIVSDKSILTAGHCVCIRHNDEKRVPTCLEDMNGPQNQNRHENYVHYTFELYAYIRIHWFYASCKTEKTSQIRRRY